MSDRQQTATFAGGCFWCLASDFQKVPVKSIVSGYTGGTIENPTYEQVCGGQTGHLEAVRIAFDPERVSYAQLLDAFWHMIDPTDDGGQFVDRGASYRSAIFYHTPMQRSQAEASRLELALSGRFAAPIVTAILPAGPFYAAEEHHQGYAQACPIPYRLYRGASGRDAFLAKAWGGAASGEPVALRVPREERERKLEPLEYAVTQNAATEPPHASSFAKGNARGIYVDVVSGQPLFSTRHQFNAACGWPSFTQPIDESSIRGTPDHSHGMERTEVRSALADSHLGHVFDDGPTEAGLRYCINGAALRFVPLEEMDEAGYGAYRKYV